MARPQEFRRALPDYSFQFPRDHGAHPAFRLEWWYFTGNLENRSGRPFGFQLTVFRTSLLPPEAPLAQQPLVADQVFLGHFALTDGAGKIHQSWQRIGRPGLGQGHADTEHLDVAMSDWRIEMPPGQETIRLAAAAGDGRLELTLEPLKPLVIHGERGVHQKAADPGQASHYISYTRLAARGQLDWRGDRHEVAGLAWMDHEFGSNQLGPDEVGWDWFAIQLAGGSDLMLYQIRRRDGTVNPFSRGTIVEPGGDAVPIPSDQYTIRPLGRWTSPHSAVTYPMGWEIVIPDRRARLRVEPLIEDQELATSPAGESFYWEGAVRIEGTWEGRPADGRGYVELVGYDRPMDRL
jgi:predicted secreted hydrolase